MSSPTKAEHTVARTPSVRSHKSQYSSTSEKRAAPTLAPVGHSDSTIANEKGDMTTTAAAWATDEILEDDSVPPLDTSRYGYVIVFCGFMIYFVVFGTEHTFGVYQQFATSDAAPEFLHGASSERVAMIGTLATTFTYLLGMLSGRFVDQYGYRAAAIVGSCIMAAGLIGASFAQNIATLYGCQGFLLGIGSSLVYLPAVACPAHWFDRHRSAAIGIVVSGSGFGGLVLGPTIEHLISSVGFRWTLRLQGLLCLIGIGGSGLFLKTRLPRLPGEANKKPPMDFRICKQVPFITLATANFLLSLGYMIPFFFLSTYSVHIGLTPKTGALLIGLMNGASLLGRIILGFVTDRVGRINMLCLCATVSGLSILCLWPVAKSTGVLVVFSLLYGWHCGGFYAVLGSVIAQLFGLDHLGTVTGALFGSVGLGYLIGAPVSGILLDMTKPNTTYLWVILFSGISMLFGGAAIAFGLIFLRRYRVAQ
ncbi:hypothetical protein DFQ27_006350 [Actinomortierella ambigua]|uniref:Major facilitator superfamily (MFS) profile domain-containing protein n=1 Tax=Actinomortierella ambigua TaxID=1343610 RepID=A0A9P6QLU0_9FUNG|nr:hypothetical protein DFQ27_006350 [Actinomortierella ambigua]